MTNRSTSKPPRRKALQPVFQGENAGQRADKSARELNRDLPRSAVLASPIDDVNRAIIALLEQDGRMAFSEIAKRLAVSEGTVRNRVNWMRQAGMLRVIAITDPTAVNYKADAMIGINVARDVTPREVGERLALNPEVVYVLWVSGRFDLLVEIVCDDEERYHAFLEQQVYRHSDIATVEVMAGLKMIKNQFLLKRSLPI